jgi:hypothetical protein
MALAAAHGMVGVLKPTSNLTAWIAGTTSPAMIERGGLAGKTLAELGA